MGLKEIVRRMLYSFFVIFSGSVLAMYAYLLIFSQDIEDVKTTITALLVMSILGDLTYFIFYSQKDLNREQMRVRYIMHLFATIVIMLSVATYMQWVLWSEPVQIVVFVGLVVTVYVVVVLVSEYQNKKLADRLTRILKERYKG